MKKNEKKFLFSDGLHFREVMPMKPLLFYDTHILIFALLV